jgi:hypothetical protein
MVSCNRTSVGSTNLIGAITGNKVNSIRIKDVDFKYGPKLDLCQELAKGQFYSLIYLSNLINSGAQPPIAG